MFPLWEVRFTSGSYGRVTKQEGKATLIIKFGKLEENYFL